MKRTLALMALAASLTATPLAARAEAQLRAQCSVDEVGARCVFTSEGGSPGGVCATMRVTHSSDTSVACESEPVCSGTLAPGQSVTLPAAFVGLNPRTLCVNERGAPQYDACSVQVTTGLVQAPHKRRSALLPALWLFLVTSAGWVYLDAKKRGARKGLLEGPFDLGPGGWFVGAVLLWPVAFPAYLLKRGALRDAAQADDAEFAPVYEEAGAPPPVYTMQPSKGFAPPPQE